MLSSDQDLDCDIVYVDFDELFHADDMEIRPPTGYVDDQKLIAHYMSETGTISESDMVQSYNNKYDKKSSGRTAGGPKPMTKEQFYKIRPKMPRINKSDPRRNYATAYAEAYNSCDFDVIWTFLNDHCDSKNFTFIQKWVGSEQYLNFPMHLEISGIDASAEYWFSRCLLAPDLAIQLKVTKLFVRSDGFSTVASSFISKSTRLFDGELSDSLIRTVASQSAATSSLKDTAQTTVEQPVNITSNLNVLPSDASLTSHESSTSPSDEKLDVICNRAIQKVDSILLQFAPSHDPIFSLKRNAQKRKRSDSSSEEEKSFQTSKMASKTNTNNATNPTSTTNKGTETTTPSNNTGNAVKKRMPNDKTVTFLGNVTMHLNQEKKIYRMEVSFAMQPESD